jgi:predicted amidohydrolase YtcJ
LASCQQDVPVEHDKADTIYVGDNIITMDDSHKSPTAVVLRGEKIVWVGDKAQITDWVGEYTVVEELNQRALLPGFIDAHGHFSGVAATIDTVNISSPPVGPNVDIASLQANVRAHLAQENSTDRKWVIGWGYDDSLLAEQRHPTRSDLDQISTSHPIALIHVSGHLSSVNSLALELLQIDALSEDPPGGVIRRQGSSQEPNGVLEESAAQGVMEALGREYGVNADTIVRAQHTYAGHGITTIQEGGQTAEVIGMFQKAAEQGAFFLDLAAYQWVNPDTETPDLATFGQYTNRMKLAGVKMVLDGSPQGKTAYMTAPYLQPPDGQAPEYRGYPRYPDEEVDELVQRHINAGIPVLAHANGDAAIDQLLNALAGHNSETDHRTVIIHAQTIREDQLDKVAAMGLIPSYFSAHSFYWGDWHRDSVFGEARADRISPVKSTVDRNLIYTLHNDSPIVPPDMMRLIWATVNRETRSGEVLGEQQRVSVLDALRGITINAAFQSFEEDTKGSLSPGKQADLVILDRNPLHVPVSELKDIRIDRTISRGKTVFVRQT